MPDASPADASAESSSAEPTITMRNAAYGGQASPEATVLAGAAWLAFGLFFAIRAFVLGMELDVWWKPVLFVGLLTLFSFGPGSLVLAMGLRRLRAARRYGDTPAVVHLEALPVPLGGVMRGVVRTEMPADAAPARGAVVKLTCTQQFTHVVGSQDDDGRVRREKETYTEHLWSDERRMRTRTTADGTVEVPFAFTLPSEHPASTADASAHRRTVWRLHVDAEVPGADFDAEAEIPVASAAAAAETPGDASAEVAWSLDGEAAPVAHARVDGPDLLERYELGTDFDAAVSPGLRLTREPGRLELYAGPSWRRYPLGAAVAAAFAVLFCPVAYLMLTSLSFLSIGGFLGFAVVLVFAGVGVYGTLAAFTQWTRLVVEGGWMEVEGRLGGVFARRSERLPVTDLDRVGVRTNGANEQLVLVRRHEPPDAAAERKARTAFWSRIAGPLKLPSVDPALTTEEAVAQHFAERRLLVPVARDLTHHQEAEWLADQIQAAADRQADFA